MAGSRRTARDLGGVPALSVTTMMCCAQQLDDVVTMSRRLRRMLSENARDYAPAAWPSLWGDEVLAATDCYMVPGSASDGARRERL